MDKQELVDKVEHCNSKQSALILADLLIKQPTLINIIFDMMEKEVDKKHWKAAWIFDHVYDANKKLIDPYLDRMIPLFTNTRSSSIQRIVGKLLSFYDINNKIDGVFINTCFDMLISPTVLVAVKVDAMQLIYNTTSIFPELKSELKLTIEEHIPNNSVGFKSRAKKLLKKL